MERNPLPIQYPPDSMLAYALDAFLMCAYADTILLFSIPSYPRPAAFTSVCPIPDTFTAPICALSPRMARMGIYAVLKYLGRSFLIFIVRMILIVIFRTNRSNNTRGVSRWLETAEPLMRDLHLPTAHARKFFCSKKPPIPGIGADPET